MPLAIIKNSLQARGRPKKSKNDSEMSQSSESSNESESDSGSESDEEEEDDDEEEDDEKEDDEQLKKKTRARRPTRSFSGGKRSSEVIIPCKICHSNCLFHDRIIALFILVNSLLCCFIYFSLFEYIYFHSNPRY